MDFRENLIVCFGSPMIDITARVTYDFLQQYKLKRNNAASYSDNCIRIFEDLQTYNPTFTVGGSITHTTKAIQNSLRSPGTCCYIGAIGADEFGKDIYRKLKSENINVLFEEIDSNSTAKCAVMLIDDNRSLVTDLAASQFLSEDFIETDIVKNAISQGEYYYLSAFFFRVSRPVIHKICSYTKAENKTLIFNIGAPFLCLEYAKDFKQTLPYVNILIGNAEEAMQLAHTLDGPDTDIKSTATYLYNQCCKSNINETLVIITRSEKSIILASTNGIMEFKVPVLQIANKSNTCGAGDYFAGGFLANYLLKKPIEDCIISGVRLCQKLIEENS